MDTKELATYLGISIATVKRWRKLGIGPQYRRIGPKKIMYDKLDVDEWLDTGLTEATPIK